MFMNRQLGILHMSRRLRLIYKINTIPIRLFLG